MLAKAKVRGPQFERAADHGISGHEAKVERAHAIKAQLADLQREYEGLQTELREIADGYKGPECSVYLAGDEDRLCRVTWQRSRRALGEGDLPGVRASLGPVADELLTETIAAKLKGPKARKADIPTLLVTLVNAGADPRWWFDVASAWDVGDLDAARRRHPKLLEQIDQIDADTLTHTPKVYLETAKAKREEG